MQSKDLIVSTEKPGGFLSGVLTTDSILQWNPDPSNFQTGTCGVTLILGEAKVGELAPLTSTYIQTTTAQVDAPFTFLVRAACHKLLDRIPDQALPELCESLGRMWGFYSEKTSAPLALLPSPTQGKAAKRGKTFQRPDFTATAE